MSKTFTQFRKDNVTTTVPSALEYGKEVYYKDANGVLTLYVGDENGAGQPSVGGAKPERVVNVFGTADNVAPNFTTIPAARTYATSLTPTASEPVVIRMFAKSNGEPYTMADDPDAIDWYEYATIDHIYFTSDFVRLNTYNQIPTTLPAGQQVWYIDANGVETLWVGNESGNAVQVSEALVYGTFTPTFTVADAGTITASSTLRYSRKGKTVHIYGGCSITTNSPVGTVILGNLPHTPSQSCIGFYRVGSLETQAGVSNSTYGCNSSGGGIELGDGSVLDLQTSFFIEISYEIA